MNGLTRLEIELDRREIREKKVRKKIAENIVRAFISAGSFGLGEKLIFSVSDAKRDVEIDEAINLIYDELFALRMKDIDFSKDINSLKKDIKQILDDNADRYKKILEKLNQLDFLSLKVENMDENVQMLTKQVEIHDQVLSPKLGLSENDKAGILEPRFDLANYLSAFPQYSQIDRNFNQIKYEYNFQKAPKVPEEFINRTEYLFKLKNALKDKPLLFISGITRGTKTFIVSQFLKRYNIKKYYWYDFKENSTKDNDLFFSDLSRYIDQMSGTVDLYAKWSIKSLTISELSTRLISIIKSHKLNYLIIDNIHLVGNEEQLFLIAAKLCESKSKLNIIFISEEKHTLNTYPYLFANSNSIEINGFSETEIKEIFKKNRIKTEKLSEDLISFIKFQTQGHPDLINGLITQLKTQVDKGTNYDPTIKLILDGWKAIPGSELISTTLAKQLFQVILSTDIERKYFNRLCVLFYAFDINLAHEVAKINPEIEDYTYLFNKISSKLLDFATSNKFSIPKLFKDIGLENISIEEKNKVLSTAAAHLLKPKNKSIDFNNASEACYYLLLSKNWGYAFFNVTNILNKIIFKDLDHKSLQYALNKLNVFQYLNPIKGYEEQQVFMYVLFLKGYSKLKDEYNSNLCEQKISNMVDKIKSPIHRTMTFVFLLSYYSNNILKIEESLIYAKEIAANLNSDINVQKLFEQEFLSTSLLIPIYQLISTPIPIFDKIIELINYYILQKIDLKLVFSKTFLNALVDIVYAKIFKAYFTKQEINLDEIGAQINNILELGDIFEKNNSYLGARNFYYLASILILEFEKDPKKSIIYSTKSKKLHKDHFSKEDIFKAQIYLSEANAYYNLGNFKRSIKPYEISLTLFKLDQQYLGFALHCQKRISICFSSLKNLKMAEKNFGLALQLSRKQINTKNISIFETIGDLSTHYINNKKYVKAVKCFSIMLLALKPISIMFYFQSISQSMGWLKNSFNKNWDGKLKNIDGTSSDKDWDPPYFGKYLKISEDSESELTYLSLKFILAELELKVGLTKRAVYRFIKINQSIPKTRIEYSAKLQVIDYLFSHSNKEGNYSQSIDYAFTHLESISSNWSQELMGGFTLDQYFMVFLDKYLRIFAEKCFTKFKMLSEFEDTLSLLLRTIDYIEKFPNDIQIKLNSYLHSTVGWSYAINAHLEKSFPQKSKYHISLSERFAKSINFNFVRLTNAKNRDFVLRENINDLRTCFTNNLKTALIIINDWNESYYQTNSFLSNFINLWENVELDTKRATKEEKDIFSMITQILVDFGQYKIDNLNENQKMFLWGIVFLKLYDVIEFKIEDISELCKFCLNNYDESLSKFLQIVLYKYSKIQKSKISKEIGNAENMIKIAEESKDALMDLKNKYGKSFDAPRMDEMNKLIKEFDILAGKLN